MNQIEKRNVDYSFSLKRTQDGYAQKPISEVIEKMRFTTTCCTVSQLSKWIGEGYAFCPIDRSKEKCQNMTGEVVFIDIDHTPYDMKTTLEKVQYKPTIAYDTFSCGSKKGEYSYRFVYVFNEPYKGSDFNFLYEHIIDSNDLKYVDVREVNQYYNGTNKNVVETGIIYDLPPIPENYKPKYFNNKAKASKSLSDKEQKKWSEVYSQGVLIDFLGMSYTAFVEKCRNDFGTELKRHIPYEECNDPRILIKPDNYLELPIKYRWNKETKRMKEVRLMDGENRHGNLFVAGNIMRRMEPNIGADELLYFMVDYMQRYIDNSDNKFNKRYMLRVVANCMESDIDTPLKEVKASSFKVDSRYCYRNGISKREVANKVNGEKRTAIKLQRWAEYDKWYKAELSDRENVQLLEQQGIKCSLRTYKTWKREYGYTKVRKSAKPK